MCHSILSLDYCSITVGTLLMTEQFMLINMLMLVGMAGSIKQVTFLMNLTVTYKFVIVWFQCFIIVAQQCFAAHSLKITK